MNDFLGFGRAGFWGATHRVAPTCWGVPVYGARDVYSLAPFAMPPAGSPAPRLTLSPLSAAKQGRFANRPCARLAEALQGR